jgi:hypothetical protein
VHLHRLAAAAALFLSGGFISSARAQPDEYFDAVLCGVILTDETRPGAEAAREAAQRIAWSYVESGVVSEEDFDQDRWDAGDGWDFAFIGYEEEAEQKIASCIRDFQYR